jgi:hypothetical protein
VTLRDIMVVTLNTLSKIRIYSYKVTSDGYFSKTNSSPFIKMNFVGHLVNFYKNGHVMRDYYIKKEIKLLLFTYLKVSITTVYRVTFKGHSMSPLHSINLST